MGLIIDEETCADKHEEHPYGNGEEDPHRRSPDSGFVGLRGQISLNNRLIRAIFLDGIEDPVYRHDEKGEMRKIEGICTESRTVAGPGDAQDLGRRGSSGEEKDKQ